MDCVIRVNNITLSNGYSLDFEYPIKKVLQVGCTVIILIEPPASIIYNHNVFAFSITGDFLWRIGDVKFYYWSSGNCPYIGLIVNNDGDLLLFNWCDTAVIVNPLTGEVVRTYQTK